MSDKNSKSNYDRWKPGTKLACMMSLKTVCQDPKFFDPTNNRYNSLTWHTVAENLNQEYPHYAKRFTNINVKDRYDRVLKHHKVFKKLANKLNGFNWNPKNFCFELNESLLKKYEQAEDIHNKLSGNELNIARFLSKPGHIDLEYYHRYIYQIPNEEELRNDLIINSPSYIEDAISKGILNLITKSNFIPKDQAPGGTSSGLESNEFNTSPGLYQPSMNHQSSSSSSNATNSSNSIPLIHSHLPSTSSSSIPNNNSSISSSSSSLIPSSNSQSLQGPLPQHIQQISNPGIPTSIHPHPQHPHQHPHHHPHHPPPPPSGPQSELDFQNLIGSQPDQSSNSSHSTLSLNPLISESSTQQGIQNLRQNSISNNQPPFKKPRTSISSTGPIPNNLPPGTIPSGIPSGSIPANIINTGLMSDTYETYLSQQQGGGQAGKFNSFSSGEAILQLHKEFEMMKNLINEEVLNLRISKLINNEDFQKIQVLINSNDQFVRSCYKRIGDDQKLIELMNIYLNKI